jgi:hypothetical protein
MGNELAAASAPRLLTTAEVARELRFTVGRVRRLAKDGVLNPVRITPHGSLRFRAEEIEALIRGEGGP